MTIVITQPFFFEGEAERICQLLQRGDVDLIHIRKPDSSYEDMDRLIASLPDRLHRRLVVHDHFQLAQKYSLRGLHLNRRHPLPPPGWQGQLSISCHSIAELEACRRKPYDYMSLSPIFDSISKQGYRAGFSEEVLSDARLRGIIDRRVMALGGVTFGKVSEVQRMGFGGAMILGDAWR